MTLVLLSATLLISPWRKRGRSLLTPSDTCQVLPWSTYKRQLSCTQRTKLFGTKCCFKSAFVLWIPTSPQTAESLHVPAPSCLPLFGKVTALPFWACFLLLLILTKDHSRDLWSTSDFKRPRTYRWNYWSCRKSETIFCTGYETVT